MEWSVQEEEIMAIWEAVAKRGYTLQDATRVPAVTRPQKKPKSCTVCEALNLQDWSRERNALWRVAPTRSRFWWPQCMPLSIGTIPW